jgi:hypothetical protein
MVDNVDRNTIAGIMFLSIHLDSVSTADNTTESIANSPAAPTIEEEILVAGDQYTIETNFGYVRFNTDVTVLSQSGTEVVIIVPYDVNTLEITTKDTNGDLVIDSKEVA